MKRFGKKQKILSYLGVTALLASLFAPRVAGVVQAVKQMADVTDCVGLCQEEVVKQ